MPQFNKRKSISWRIKFYIISLRNSIVNIKYKAKAYKGYLTMMDMTVYFAEKTH